MRRRQLLRYVGAGSGASLLAGCTEGSDEQLDLGEDDGESADDGASDDQEGDENEGVDDGDGEDDVEDGNGEDDVGNGADEDVSDENGEQEEHDDQDRRDEVDGGAELWHTFTAGESDQFDSILETFNTEYDATITAEEVGDLEDRTQSAIPAGDGPELFIWAHDWIGNYHENGFLSDQGGNLTIDPTAHFGNSADVVTYDGDVVGLPFAGETVALACNREYVATLPETFEEVLEIAANHHDPANNVYGFCWPQDAYHVSAMPHGFGPGYYDEDSGELTLTDEGTVAGFEYIVDNVWEYMPQDPDFQVQQETFFQGQSPFYVTGPWNLGNFENNGLEVDVIPLPDAQGITPSPFTGLQLFYFTAAMGQDPNQEAAALAFAEWFTTDVDVLRELALEQEFIPVHEAFGLDGTARRDLPQSTQAFSIALEQGTPMPTAPEFQNIWEPVETEWRNVLNGGRDVAQAMADAEKQIRDAW